jgi:hypothetical protein
VVTRRHPLLGFVKLEDLLSVSVHSLCVCLLLNGVGALEHKGIDETVGRRGGHGKGEGKQGT